MMFDQLTDHPRLLMDVRLAPVQGTRFQPTGFPDLGAADYTVADGTRMLLVESAQSMANRLEEAVWDSPAGDWIPALRGLPYVQVVDEAGKMVTNSVLESHRLNSPYILESKDKSFFERLQAETNALEKGRPDLHQLGVTLARYDVNSLLHGVFLAKKELAGGRLRLPRALSAFIEARDVTVAASGGLKRDDVDPSGDAKKGFGHVPFHRDEYTGAIIAYFNLDLAQLRGMRLPEPMFELLVTVALIKVQRFLRDGLRLRTACDLKPVEPLQVRAPEGLAVPELPALEASMAPLIEKARSCFASPAVTRVVYKA
jgi:CRISPR-associated protein Csb1